ncbi:hypothetical protein Y032_0498g2543 [Ancylostoma ceylanicum]|nr:hypothetical protein Y032_0498g2543 [Ancylostoma ceylanicum]
MSNLVKVDIDFPRFENITMETLIAFLLCFGIATAIDCPSMSNLVKVDIDFPRFVALVNVTKIEDLKSDKGDEYVRFYFHYKGFYKLVIDLEISAESARRDDPSDVLET